jgi:hypothetical protein
MHEPASRLKPITIAIVIVIGSVLWAIALAFDFVPELRGGFGWVWLYQAPTSITRILPVALGMPLYILVASRLMNRRPACWLLIWSVIGTCGLTLAGIFIQDSPFLKLYALTVAPIETGWHIAAIGISDMGKTLREWPAFMQYAVRYSDHVKLAPPGAVLFYYELIQLFQGVPGIARALADPLRQAMCQNYTLAMYTDAQLASAWPGMLMPLWGGLTALPMYWLGKRMFPERVARWTVLWWPLIPSLLLFIGAVNTFFPLLTTWVILLLVDGLGRGKWWLVVCAGLFASVMTFINLSLAPLIFLAGMLILLSFLARTRLYTASARAFAPKRALWLWPLVVGAFFGAGLLSVWVAYYFGFGVTVFDIMRTAAEPHLALDRPYLPWLYLHLYDYFMFAGWPIIALAAISVAAAVRAWLHHHPLDAGKTLLLSAAAALIVLDISGIMRGETGRLLLFFTPFFLYGAGSVLETGAFASDKRAAWIVTGGQVAVVLAMLSVLNVMWLEPKWNSPSPVSPPQVAQPSPRDEIINGAVFDDVLHLIGFSGYVDQYTDANGTIESTLNLWLEWQSSGQLHYPYWMSLLPVAPDGTTGKTVLRHPFGDLYPTSCWLPRSGVIREQITLPLPATSKEGAYWVSLALLDNNGNRVTVIMPDGSRDTQTGIGGFTR